MRPQQDIEQFKFDNDVSLTRDVNNRVSKVVQTGKLGGMTKTLDLTRDGDGRVTAITVTTN